MTDMTYANIHFKKFADQPEDEKVAITTFLEPLIHHLALNNPQWILTGEGYKFGFNTKTHYATVFNISEKREHIGKVETGTYNGKSAFVICNERITDSRKRGEASKTTDIKKAIKIISKFVSRVTIGEMLENARASASCSAYNVDGQKYRDFATLYGALQAEATNFLVDNWEEFSKRMMPTPCVEFPAKVREYSIAHKVKLAHENDTTYLVLINGIDYVVKRGQGEVELLSSEKLPEFIRRGVGMLKLVENSQIIDGVGLKVDDNIFIVMPEA